MSDKNGRFKIITLAAVVCLCLGVVIAEAMAHAANSDGKGPEKIEINGGKRGVIPFPHRAHQERLGDCNRCHSLFPKEHQALKNLKEAGKLSRKQVMNKLCIKCHKAEKRAGKPSGPTTCSKCHVRK